MQSCYFIPARSSNSPSSNEIPNRNNDSQAIRTDIGPPKLFKFHTKPPLAGPYAFSRFPKPAWDHPRIYLKHAIENTWFFLNSPSSGYVIFIRLSILQNSINGE